MRLTALPAAAVLVVFCAGPVFAQPTTPVPGPRDPDQPPMSAGPLVHAHAVGDAGTGLAVVRLAPDSTPTNTILPGFGERLPEQSAAEIGLGLASATWGKACPSSTSVCSGSRSRSSTRRTW